MPRRVDWYGVVGATVCFTGLLMLIFPEPRKSPRPPSPPVSQLKPPDSASEPDTVADQTRTVLPASR